MAQQDPIMGPRRRGNDGPYEAREQHATEQPLLKSHQAGQLRWRLSFRRAHRAKGVVLTPRPPTPRTTNKAKARKSGQTHTASDLTNLATAFRYSTSRHHAAPSMSARTERALAPKRKS